jgi:outer membrane protein assembly factor BamB
VELPNRRQDYDFFAHSRRRRGLRWSLDKKVYALDAVSGGYLWSFTTDDAVISTPAVTGGAVFVGSDDGNIYALAASNGSTIWKHATGGPVFSSPTLRAT